ncbi:MAG: hypothetical protein IPI59_16085 [Sphingobacteriales bacterium]|nr:hypothetical protein [Sphingobacteriales bacterium]
MGRPSGTVADDVVAYLKENPFCQRNSNGNDIKRQNDSFGALEFSIAYIVLPHLPDYGCAEKPSLFILWSSYSPFPLLQVGPF